MKERGFTVVEVLVVIIVMAILLTLAVVNIRSSQVNARDAERRADVENIAMVLETFYNGTHPSMYSGVNEVTKVYPGSFDLINPPEGSYVPDYLKSRLPKESLYAPGTDPEGAWSLVAATNTNTTPTGVTPQPTISTYVYQPMQESSFCNGAFFYEGCKSFSIYYALEAPTPECPDSICVVRSKHQ